MQALGGSWWVSHWKSRSLHKKSVGTFTVSLQKLSFTNAHSTCLLIYGLRSATQKTWPLWTAPTSHTGRNEGHETERWGELWCTCSIYQHNHVVLYSSAGQYSCYKYTIGKSGFPDKFTPFSQEKIDSRCSDWPVCCMTPRWHHILDKSGPI